MSALRWWSALFLALAVVAGASLWLQRQEAEGLRGEIARLCEERSEARKVREENRRLAVEQTPPEELVRLRADHEALVRLRREIEKLRAGLQARERELAQPAKGAK